MEKASRQPVFNCYVPVAERGVHRFRIKNTNLVLVKSSHQYTSSWVKWKTKIEHLYGLCFPCGKFQVDLRQARKLLL